MNNSVNGQAQGGGQTLRPTAAPRPTESPKPTISPRPTVTLTDYPSASPSLPESRGVETQDHFFHQLTISEQRGMEETEQFLYAFIMENLTLSIGEKIGEPFIIANCTVTETTPSIIEGNPEFDLDDNLTVETYVLMVEFDMRYESRYGYNDTINYPEYLLTYLNTNQEELTGYMRSVINIESEYILYAGDAFILDPPVETVAPTGNAGSPSFQPSQGPTLLSSPVPSIAANKSNIGALGTGGIVAIILGVVLGTILCITGVKILPNRRTDTEKIDAKDAQEEPNGEEPNGNGPNSDLSSNHNIHSSNHDNSSGYAFVAMPLVESSEPEEELGYPQTPTTPVEDSTIDNSLSQSGTSSREESDALSMVATVSRVQSTTMTSMTSPTSIESDATTRSKQRSDITSTFAGTNLMMRDDSFSSDSNDDILSPRKIMEEDVFDKYKNQVLEKLRNEVESTIDDVDGIMSLAMTRLLMEADGTQLDLSWVGAEDPASIEASCYFEAYEWRKQNAFFPS